MTNQDAGETFRFVWKHERGAYLAEGDGTAPKAKTPDEAKRYLSKAEAMSDLLCRVHRAGRERTPFFSDYSLVWVRKVNRPDWEECDR
jgi:hypothetical protein